MIDKVRVHEIAKELGINSKEVVDKAAAIGLNVKTASSSVSMVEAELIMNYIMSAAAHDSHSSTIVSKLPKQFIQSNIDLEAIKTISISIQNLKSINTLTWSFEFKKGLHAIIAENGSGKSSLIVSLGKLVSPKSVSAEFIGKGYEDSIISYHLDSYNYSWRKNPLWSMFEGTTSSMPTIEGVIESSILSGSRFKSIGTKRIEREVTESVDGIEDIDDFISHNMNYILYGTNEGKFTNLKYIIANKKVKRRRTKQEFPIYSFYALKKHNTYIKEYFFSTGEYFLLSLLKFIHEHRRHSRTYPALIIIDEIELSLHPLAQKRLIDKVSNFANDYNLLFIFATHSLQIIDRIHPTNIHYLQNKDGICNIVNPIYPSYLSSKLYIHNSFDFVILVEDTLAKQYIDKIIRRNLTQMSMSFIAIPIGGWEKLYEMYKLHHASRIYGSAKILLVFDGDVQKIPEANQKKYNSFNKRYLPFDNLEKLIVRYLKENEHNFFTFLDSYLMPISFHDLGVEIKDGDTKQIKNTFYKLVEKMAKQCMLTEELIIDKILDQVLKQNSENSIFKKTEYDICSFLELASGKL